MLKFTLALSVPSPILPIFFFPSFPCFISWEIKYVSVVIGSIQEFLDHLKINFKLGQIESSCKIVPFGCILPAPFPSFLNCLNPLNVLEV